jgi:translocation and assembly module TamB
VEQGHYLFTLLNVVNKPFVIKKGGTIKWSGDPLGAIINLEATYENLSATPYNFILEYLNEADEKSNAQRTTPVDLTMKLQGELFKPDISFDISFPSLRGRLRNYTDSKLRIITEDENELNRQVLGLIAFGSFFPSDLAYSSSGLLDGGINTLSELLSNQLSIYISELLSEVITDVDIDFNYRYYEYTEITDEEDILRTGNELEIRLKKGLFNNRLVINAGSNIDVDGGTTSSAFLAGDLLIEYLLTPDGKFKLRFYSEWDETISGTQNQTGVGFTYRKDFDKFSELFKKNRKNTFKIEKEYNVFLDNLRKAAAESIEN